MNKRQEQLLAALREKRLVKVIAGIDNVDPDRVAPVVRAAEAAGAGAVDVAACADIVRLARENTNLPVFASAVTPEALAEAVRNGADAVEIGNFDALYKDGFYLTAEDVLELTRKTQAMIPGSTMLSVTVPGHLRVEAQVYLAQHLEAMGVTMLQTEGASRVIGLDKQVQLLSAEDKARLTMENTLALCQAVAIPVMTASGITVDNVQEAFALGAAAVGVGSTINRLSTEAEMVDTLKALMAQVVAVKPAAQTTLAS